MCKQSSVSALVNNPLPGLTLKQFAVQQFLDALERYRVALQSGTHAEIVRASVALHLAKSDATKRFHRLIRKAFENTVRTAPLEA